MGSLVSFLVLALKGKVLRKTVHIEKCLDLRFDGLIFLKNISLKQPLVMKSIKFTRHITSPPWEIVSLCPADHPLGRKAGLQDRPVT